MTWLSMNCPSSENSTMSSKRPVDLAAGEPEHRAVQVDVVPAADSSLLEARAELQQARPASPARPPVPSSGWSTPQMHLSRVDLPEPLRPRMPTVSPSSTSKSTSLQRPEVLVGDRPGVDDPLLQRGVLLVVEAEPLGDVLDLDGAAPITAPRRSCPRGGRTPTGRTGRARALADSTTASKLAYHGHAVVWQHGDRGARGVGAIHGDLGVDARAGRSGRRAS